MNGKHEPRLDGLRGVAILLVVACHLFPASPLPGWLGVDVFFVLSGYLITSLLLARGGLRLPRFYGRRVARLYPALLLMVAVTAPLGAAAGLGGYRFALVAASYAANYFQANRGHIGLFSHTWSLAVEEQFYLLWPLVLMVTLRSGRRVAGMLAAAGCIGTWALLLIGYHSWTFETWSYRSEVRGGGLLLGCAVALFAPQAGRWAGKLGVFVIAATLVVGAGEQQRGPEFYIPAVVIGTALVIVNPPDFLADSWLVGLGKISYSLYLWHYPALAMLNGRSLPVRVAGLSISVVAAVISFSLVEQPVRRWAYQQIDRRQRSQPVRPEVLDAPQQRKPPWDLGLRAVGGRPHPQGHGAT